MKISNLIKKLQEMQAEHGDQPIVVPDGNDHNPSEGQADIYFAEEDENWLGRFILCPGKKFNPSKD